MDKVTQLGTLRLKVLKAVKDRPQSTISLQQATGIDGRTLPILLANMRGLVTGGNPNDLGSVWTITPAGAGVLAVNDPKAAGAYT